MLKRGIAEIERIGGSLLRVTALAGTKKVLLMAVAFIVCAVLLASCGGGGGSQGGGGGGGTAPPAKTIEKAQTVPGGVTQKATTIQKTEPPKKQ